MLDLATQDQELIALNTLLKLIQFNWFSKAHQITLSEVLAIRTG